MGSQTPVRLPVLDFSKPDLKPGSPEWDLVRANVRQALEEFGCFEAKFDRVPVEIRKGIFGASEEFFELPLETKMLNSSKKPLHGYLGQYPSMPLYESMSIDDAHIMENVNSLSNNILPQGNQSFSKNIQSFSEKVSELDKTIRRMVLESFGLEKYMEEHMNSTNYVFRVMKYKAPQTSEAKFGLSTHTDKNILTILYQNQVEGLEVQTKDGQWINIKPSPESFIAMAGDSLHAWTNGKLHSSCHRVMMTGNKTRYSAGLFSSAKGGYMIKAPEELVDEEHPLLFKPFDYVKLLRFYYTEAGQKAQCALKTYCGV